MSGQASDFTLIVTIGYTGLRWGETIGLEHPFLHTRRDPRRMAAPRNQGHLPPDPAQRRLLPQPEMGTRPARRPAALPDRSPGPPGRSDRRSPLQLRQASTRARGRYLFTGPDGGHYRRSNYARRIFRPACDGRYPSVSGKPPRLIIADTTTLPGIPIAAWPAPPVTGDLASATGNRRAAAASRPSPTAPRWPAGSPSSPA